MRSFLFLLVFFTIPVLSAAKDVSLVLSWKHQFQFAGYYIAKEKGFYKEEGLNVSIKEYDLNNNNARDVSMQKYDFGIGHSSLILDRLDHYKNLVLLAAIHQSSPLILLAKKRPDIHNVSDIAGKKIMMTNDQTFTASVNAMLISEKLEKNSFSAIDTSFEPLDLINGKADLMIAYASNEPFVLQEKGIDYTIFDPKDYGYNFYSDFLFTSAELLKQSPATVSAFYKASIRGWLYAYTYIEESIDIIHKYYNTQGRTRKALRFEAQTLKKLAFKEGINFGDINSFRLREMLNTYRLLGLVESQEIALDNFVFQPSQSDKQKKVELSKKQNDYITKKGYITFCIASDNMPFESIENNQIMGIAADLVLPIKKDINVPISFVQTNDVFQSFEFLKQKKCDIIPVVTKDIAMEPELIISKPYINIPLVLVTHKSSPFVYSPQSIDTKSIAMVKNQNFIKNFSHRQVQQINSLEDGLAQIADNELYGMIVNVATLKKCLEKNIVNEFQFTHNIEQTMPVSLAMRAEDTILYNIFAKQLDSIQSSEVSHVMNKWLSAEQSKPYFDSKFVFLFLVIFIAIITLVQLANIRLKRLVKDKTTELKQQMNVFDENISASNTDINGVITYASEAFCKASGYSNAELLGKTHAIIRDAMTPDEVYQDLWLTIKSGHVWKGELKNRRKNGQEYWVESVISPVRDKKGTINGFNAILQDVTLKKVLYDFNQKLEKEVINRTDELSQSRHYLDMLFDINPSIAFVVNGKKLERVNKAFLNFTHYQSLNDFLQDHQCVSELFEQRDGYLQLECDPLNGVDYPVADKKYTYKTIMINNDQEHIFSLNAQQFMLDGQQHYLVILEDITQIENTAVTDKLTGLSNRANIDEYLALYIEKYYRYAQIFSVILIDIDHFKLINDTFGHQVGDDVLKQIASLMKRNSRNIDIVGRWGGEEFMIICPYTDLDGAVLLAETIRKNIENYPFNLQKTITASMGVAQISHGMRESDIVFKADTALYKAKNNGRNNIVRG